MYRTNGGLRPAILVYDMSQLKAHDPKIFKPIMHQFFRYTIKYPSQKVRAILGLYYADVSVDGGDIQK